MNNKNKAFFERNRYSSEEYLKEFKNKKTSIVSSKEDNYIRLNDLEIHFTDEQLGYALSLIEDVLSNITEIDNMVQKFCADCYNHSQVNGSNWHIRNFKVFLAWMEVLEENKVHLQYWGEIVNLELETIFIKEEGKWKSNYFCWC